MAAIVRGVAWRKDDPFGAEFAEVTFASNRLSAIGVALGAGPLPYRLDYTLETSHDYVTKRLRVTARGDGWRRTLDLRRAPGISTPPPRAKRPCHWRAATWRLSPARSTATSASHRSRTPCRCCARTSS